MKEISGYLIDRETGVGISGKTVTFKNLAGASFASQASPYIGLDAVTDGNGRFRGQFELSPGPVNVEVTVSGTEKKARKYDEKAQFGYSWNSDQRHIARALREGVITGYLNELAVSIPAGHTIRIATGAAVFNGNAFSIENGNMDIAGTANTNPLLNPRLDLITLRQYNEDAPGQDAGRQEVVVTLGTSQNVAPATPTGATFKDFPLRVVSTAHNAATKTLGTDLRVFTGEVGNAAPLFDMDEAHTDSADPWEPLTTSYVTHVTPNVTGLDSRKTYDGEIFIHGNLWLFDQTQEVNARAKMRLNSTFMAGGVLERVISVQNFDVGGSGSDYDLQGPIAFSWPIIGVSGVSSFSLPVELKAENVQPGASLAIGRLYASVILKERR